MALSLNISTFTKETDIDYSLTSNSSYIIVASGEENPTNIPQSYRSVGPNFIYLYDDHAYMMRHITVTAADNHQLAETSEVDLLSKLRTKSISKMEGLLCEEKYSVS